MPFLDFPAEIRNHIYHHYFTDSVIRMEAASIPVYMTDLIQPRSDLELGIKRRTVICKSRGRPRRYKV